MDKKPLSVHYVDDVPLCLKMVGKALDDKAIKGNYGLYQLKITPFSSIDEFIDKNTYNSPDVLLLDIIFGHDSDAGLRLLKAARKKYPHSVICMYSNLDDSETIVKYICSGADSFICKTSNFIELGHSIVGQFEAHNGCHSHKNLGEGISGATMKKIAQRIPDLVESDISTIHITGEPGTGKELVADLFHEFLDTKIPFIRENCGAITPNLITRELFGHVKGAFTGASVNLPGLFDVAANGWFFLDEIDLLPLDAQGGLLRVMERGEYRPIGAKDVKRIKVRIITASNKKLTDLVQQNKFLPDLWERLSTSVIHLPALRHRKNEIPIIANHLAQKLQTGPYKIPTATMSVFLAYNWPGNIRELDHCIRSMTEFAKHKILEPGFLPERIIKNLENSKKSIIDNNYAIMEQEFFITTIKNTLKNHKVKNRTELAKKMGIPRSTLSRRLDQLIKNQCMEPII